MKEFDYTAKGLGRERNKGTGLAREERRGELNHNAGLTDSDARSMREYRAEGFSYKDLRLLFGVSNTTVANIIKGKSYVTAGGPVETGRYARHCQSLQVRRRKRTRELDEEIRRLRETTSLSQRAIADKLEISQALVSAVLLGKAKEIR